MKTIKKVKIGVRNIETDIKENGDLLYPIIEKYFDVMVCHMPYTVINSTSIYQFANTALFYPRIDFDKITFNIVSTIEMDIDIRYHSIFLDNAGIYFKGGIEKSFNVIKIVTDNLFAGYYVPELNFLIATDWSHDVLPNETYKKIDSFLKADLKAKKVSVKPIKTKNNYKITIGCDPEFEAIRNNTIIDASRYFSFGGEIGTDGAGSQLELRPLPSSKPIEIIKHIKSLLKHASNTIDDLSVLGDYYPLGGHIHIGGIVCTDGIIELLDDFIGKQVIDLSGKARGSYRRLSSIETKPYGFEYRTPPSAIFHNPNILKIILKIAKNVIKKAVSKGVIEYGCPVDYEEYKKIAKLSDKEIDYFKNFISNYKELPKQIFAYWKVKPKKKKDLEIIFNDEWDELNKSYILNKLSKMKLKKGITITLFGLKSSRGLASTIPIDGFELCTEFTNRVNSIGLPYILRKTWNDDVIKLLDKAIKQIKNYIKEKQEV